MKYLLLTLFICINCNLSARQGIPVSSNKYYQKIKLPEKATKPDEVTVTVTPENKNQVTWFLQPYAAIDHYKIYKKSVDSMSEWICIGRVKYGKDTSYVDSNSLPSKESCDYLVSLVDPCGNELFCDSVSKSIHLTLENKVDNHYRLKWNQYTGKKILRYNILCGNTLSSMSVIDSVSSNETTYLDKSIIDDFKFYQVEAIVESTNHVKGRLKIDRSFSNKVSVLYSGLLDTIDNSKLYIFTDTNHHKVYVLFPAYDGKAYNAAIYDMTGRLVYQFPVTSDTLELGEECLQSGWFNLQIVGNDRRFNAKIKI